jgi:hypothetical protein
MGHSHEESVADARVGIEGLVELRAAIPERLWASFEQCVQAAIAGGAGDVSVAAHIRGLHLSEKDRTLLVLAYSLWRGVGPVVHIQQLWGMDPTVAARILASIAVAAGGGEALGLLDEAGAFVRDVHTRGCPTLAVVKEG